MTQWLYEEVLVVDPSRQPDFALQSSLNWIASLWAEIAAEHGSTPSEHLGSCRDVFKHSIKPTRARDELARVFEPLFAAISGAMALQSIDGASLNHPWCRPSSTVSWYYVVYTSARAMLASLGQNPAETHAATQKAFVSALQPHLPHPLDMLATRTTGESYSVNFPRHPSARGYDLARTFVDDREATRGMLLGYLSGTARWYAEHEKERLKKQKKLPNFRSKEAQAIRDSHLEGEIGFLHCAYRYRGKANYRDAIFLSYGHREPASGASFTHNLASTAAFIVLMAFALIERRLGRDPVQRFLEDLQRNLRGLDRAGSQESFWEAAVST